jgi:hypothetical protein
LAVLRLMTNSYFVGPCTDRSAGLSRLRMRPADRAWGFAGASAVLHDASGAYYGFPNIDTAGHPADKYGWPVATGDAKFNLAGRRLVLQRLPFGRRCGPVHDETAWQIYNAWIAACVDRGDIYSIANDLDALAT